ncbi:MAG TPA: hypothetical protein VNG71_08185 [Pyrinomonadaceae bacterium]|nr:hypothetical protein [Pyrinomonadaceae bacterium]
MAKFFFFTDPSLLDAQVQAQAFGPAGTSAGKDQFRITDVHTSSSATDVPAFAVCDGLICAQVDDQGTLTLILKPWVQPPFDFPAISYILYKGIDPTSLLTSGGAIDIAKETENELVKTIKTAWELEANNNTGPPTRACLGLHLNPIDYPATANPTRFASSQSLDTLFYDGDPQVQLPLVRGGWRLGTFSSSLLFGIEIVVERIGRRPKIALARTATTIVQVSALPNGANASDVFRHWEKKEEILDFVDPCALWGSFFAAKLRVWDSANDEFDKLSGNAIYETVLRGTVTGAAKFANRNRAYIDIRNEHGNSLNYYQADGPNIQLTLDAAADIDTCEVNYYASGWPSFAVDNTNLPAGTTGNKIDVRFALPKTANTRPLIYISVGYRGRFRRLKERKRFIDSPRRADAQYLYETSTTIPIADDAGVKRIYAGYQKLHDFKRPIIFNGQPVPPADPNSLAPTRASVLDYLVPLLGVDDLPVADARVILRTFDDVFYVNAGGSDADGFVANPGVGADQDNIVLILVPKAHDVPAHSSRPTRPKVAWPALALRNEGESIFQYLAGLLPAPLQMTRVANPQGSGDVELLYKDNVAGIFQSVMQNNTSAILLGLSRSDISDLKAIVTANLPVYGTPMLSLEVEAAHLDGLTAFVGFKLRLNFLSGTQIIGNVIQTSQIQVYRHVDL